MMTVEKLRQTKSMVSRSAYYSSYKQTLDQAKQVLYNALLTGNVQQAMALARHLTQTLSADGLPDSAYMTTKICELKQEN